MRRSRKTRFFLIMLLMGLCLGNSLIAMAASASFSLPVSIQLEGDLPGKAEAFEVKLVPEDPDFPMPVNGTDSLRINGEGTETFPEIRYSHPGIYRYKVYQEKGNSDCEYDTTEYQLVVTVVNSAVKEMELEISAALYKDDLNGKIQKPVFYNEYPVATETEASSEVTGESTPEVKTGVDDYQMMYIITMLLALFVICRMTIILKNNRD